MLRLYKQKRTLKEKYLNSQIEDAEVLVYLLFLQSYNLLIHYNLINYVVVVIMYLKY